MRNVTLGTGHVGIADAVAVSRNCAPVDVPAEVIRRLDHARAVVDRAATGDEPIYGLNTALGANTGAPLAPEEQQRYQTAAVRARAVGVGAPLPKSVSGPRCSRAAGMAQGGRSFRCRIPRAGRRLESGILSLRPRLGIHRRRGPSANVAHRPRVDRRRRGTRRRQARRRRASARGGWPHAGPARGQGRPCAHQLECGHRGSCVPCPHRSCTHPQNARRSNCAVLRRISCEPVAVRPAREEMRGSQPPRRRQ